MKQYFYIFIGILSLLGLGFFTKNYTTPNGEAAKIEELRSHVSLIESISPADTSFKDLEFLKDILENKDIVMLGEQTHQDGATFLAKGRLIKYLHQKLGFDVLIYETGLYDTENLWRSLKSNSQNNPTDFLKALYPFWCKNKENEELLNYVRNNINTENEIEIAGLDVQFSGRIKQKERDSVLNKYLESKPEINAKQFPAFFSIKNRYNSYAKKWVAKQLRESQKDSILKDIRSINKLFSSYKALDKEDSLYSRFFKNIETLYSYSWYYDIGEEVRFNIRDSAMAENLIWLKENKFKNKKVIVWAANLHTSYDNNSYNGAVPFTSMGEYIKKRYREKCYSINFTSFANASKLNNSEKIYNNKTIEYLLHKLNTPYSYLDFNKINSTSFLKGNILMNCNQGSSLKAKWCNITDGVFYIDKMTNIHE